jgi:tRNA-dihydrouridine synthase
MLRIHPDEHACGPETAGGPGRPRGADWAGGPVSIQLFGEDPAVMRSAAAHVAATTTADAIDINMGCPVPKVRKTGAGAALLADPDLAVALACAARAGAEEGGRGRGAGGMPITVKLRSGLRPGDTSGFALAHRLVEEAGVAAIAFHPRSAAVQHKGVPDYDLVARLVESLPAPVILTGGLSDAARVREAFQFTGASAVMLARGSLGNPWLFRALLSGLEREPTRAEVLGELDWTIDRAVEHLGEPRATRYLRKFYPWYVARLGLGPAAAKRLGESLQTAPALGAVRGLLRLESVPAMALA